MRGGSCHCWKGKFRLAQFEVTSHSHHSLSAKGIYPYLSDIGLLHSLPQCAGGNLPS